MISFEFHFKPNGQQVHATFENFVHGNGQIDHTWQTKTYIDNGQFVQHAARRAITDGELKAILDLCLTKDPERIIYHAEDNIVNIMPSETTYRLVTFDAMSGGVFRNSSVTKEQLKAITTLIFIDSEDPELYNIAEKVFDGCPLECRPIP